MGRLPVSPHRAVSHVPYRDYTFHMIRRRALIWMLPLYFFALASVASGIAVDRDGCTSGQHMATPDDVAKGLPAGACVDDYVSKFLSGGCEYNPYAVLESRYKKSGQISAVSFAGTGTLKQGIDPALACRLTKLFKAAEERGCSVKIISGYRSAQLQEDMCGAGRSGCAPAGASCHQYGLAVDVTSACIGWLRAAAPQFQLVFPYYGDHIQCAEHPRASCSPQTQPCNGGIKIMPDLTRIPRPDQVPNTYFVPPAAVQNPFSNPNTPFMQPPPPPPVPPQQQQTPPQQQGSMPAHENPFVIPPLYSTTSPTSTSSKSLIDTATSQVDVLHAINQIAQSPASKSNPGTSSQARSQPAQLIADIADASNLAMSDNTNTSADLQSLQSATTSVQVPLVGVGDTFGAEHTLAATSSGYNAPLLIAALQAVKDLLASIIKKMSSTEPTYGFSGPWKTINGTVYAY